MAKPKPELKAECMRLRVETRLSLREIAEQTGASKGSLSGWLKKHPLTEAEKQTRRTNRTPPRKKHRGEMSPMFQAYQDKTYTRQEKAKIAEAACLFRLLLQGFVVFGSVFDGDKADWVVEIPETGHIRKVQVKSAVRHQGGLPTVSLRCTVGHNKHRRYLAGDFDFIVGYDFYTDTAYVWSWADVEGLSSSVTVREEAAEQWDKMRA